MAVSDQLIKAVITAFTLIAALLGSYSPSASGSDSDALETISVPTLPTAAPTGGLVPTTGRPQVSEAPGVPQQIVPTPPLSAPTVPTPTPPPTASAPDVAAPVAPAPSGGCRYPAQILDLSNWKLTLPIAGSGSSRDGPAEIKQPDLVTYAGPPWFETVPNCDAAVFRAAVDGVTTRGSKNPRSELREMTEGGSTEASWSSDSGTHTLTVTEAFTKLPDGRPHLVGAQIHDSKDDVTVFRLEGSSLYITDGDIAHHKLVTGNYTLGTRFEAKFVVSGGQVEVYYNGALQTRLSKDFSGGYFKAGAYTQANCQNAAPCSSDNYGETMIYSISATHS